jgi:hypothetical protein
MAHMRDKHVHCQACGGQSKITANLDTGKITNIELPHACKWPGSCPNKFVEGVFDRQFGEQIIKPKWIGTPQ